ncbi:MULTISPECIES: TIGR02452 family protein [Paenibacillus]|uniref:TIGR02452 family protein n=1 Tax=Paenibacillus cucumis (ex Kampfer et al. 2016) TaxID=1776858 RepID=A0ABS7KQ38_9BACL|nr:TIGR02452 family protein [Paenibacillus cucumis (ex Kampfer et al. 2016)]MBY0206287.1 TIGR02452 family protein [Paenibacillus cucumis (ex Kampfer et al. 2016)]
MSNFDKPNKHNNISNSNNTTTGSRNSNVSTDKTGVSSRSGRSRIAHQTLEILEEGVYVNGYDRAVHIKKDMEQAIQNSVLYRPSELSQLGEKLRKGGNPARMEVTGETTLAAAARLTLEEGRTDVVCLNFASAKNPGGGFLGGSQAQEESLARATGLYPCIAQMTEMYEYNRKQRTCLYSDHMIYSPDVPVIRDDYDRLLDQYYTTAFITAPAVNAGVVKERKEATDAEIKSVMKQRIRYILEVAAVQGHRTIVLGAFGCGVFRNEPAQVASYFAEVLDEEGNRDYFDHIVFAIYDRSAGQRTLETFKRLLA